MCEPRPNWPVGHDKVAHGRVLKRKRPGRPTNPPFRWKFSGDYNDEGPTLNLSSGQERFPLFFGVSGNSTQVNEYTRVVNHTHPAAPQQPVNPNGDYPSFAPRLLRLRGGARHRRRPGPQEWTLRSDEDLSMPSLDDGSPASLSSTTAVSAADNSLEDLDQTQGDALGNLFKEPQEVDPGGGGRRLDYSDDATVEESFEGEWDNEWPPLSGLDLEEDDVKTPPMPRRTTRNVMNPQSRERIGAMIQSGDYPNLAPILESWFKSRTHGGARGRAPPPDFKELMLRVPGSEKLKFVQDEAHLGVTYRKVLSSGNMDLDQLLFEQVKRIRAANHQERSSIPPAGLYGATPRDRRSSSHSQRVKARSTPRYAPTPDTNTKPTDTSSDLDPFFD